MIPLSQLRPGLAGIIVEVACAPARRERLAALGLVRGTPVKVLQRRPALVIAVDGSEIALDPRIGHEIRVRAAHPA